MCGGKRIPVEELNVSGARWDKADKGRIRLKMKKGQTAVLKNGKLESQAGENE